jgi:DNA-binding winged helix-turn-helix (wHTH) protein
VKRDFSGHQVIDSKEFDWKISVAQPGTIIIATMAQASAVRVRFGGFEIDLRSGELFSIGAADGDGSVVLLREQSLQVLRMLIESQGKIVTREEIKRALWPNDTVVDFDHSINTNIKLLRRALGDAADKPCYIQTLARRGYRLLVATEWSDAPAPPSAAVVADILPKSRKHLYKWLASAALLVVVAAGFWMYREHRNKVTLSTDDTIVVADADNLTTDPVFDDALRTALLISLEQTPYLNVLAPDKVSGAVKLLNLPVDAKVTPEIARRVCLRTNSKLIITSSIADAGNRFRIGLNALSCKDGDVVARVWKDVSNRNEIVHIVGVSAAQLRRKLGEPVSSLAEFDKPLEQATSQSPEAVQQLAVGYKRHLALDLQGAIQHYQRATELDPDFGLAYAALGAAQSALSEFSFAAAAEKKAYDLRTRMTEQTRFQVEDLYYDDVTGEQEKAYPVLLQWVQTFPRDVIGHNNLAKCLNALGQPNRDADESREAARLLPSPWSYRNWMFTSIMANRLEEAKAVFDAAQARKFDGPDFHEERVLIAFLQKDQLTMQAQWNWAAGKPMEDRFLFGRSSVEAYHGHFAVAHHLREQAISLASKSNDPSGNVAFDYAEEALDEAAVGNSAEAQRSAQKAFTSSPNRNAKLVMALTFARAGDIGRAQRLADALNQGAPLDTVIQNYCLPAIRAAMKLHENDPAEAVEILRPTVKYDLAFPTGFNSLYPAYIRGLAYLQMGEGLKAATEFQKLLDHPGIVGREVIGALSFLQLARAQKMTGNEAAARQSYEGFLALWKDADPDIPIYQQAKSEYTRLSTRTKQHIQN